MDFEFNRGNLLNETEESKSFFQEKPAVFLNGNNVLLVNFVFFLRNCGNL